MARAADVPLVPLTGDFLFVGALGRPDLLGEEAKHALARKLFNSVREKLAPLPDAWRSTRGTAPARCAAPA